MNGEKIYECDLDVTGMTDFGVSLEAVLSGEVKIPPQGIRIDVAFAGQAKGRVTGRVHGIDHVRMRADGRVDLGIRGVIETDDGHRIALSADGVAVPRATEPIADFWENANLLTAAEKYGWVNTRQIWAIGTVNFATKKVHVEGYMQ